MLLTYTLLALILLTYCIIFISERVSYIILAMILLFCEAAALLVVNGFEFFGFILVLIYVGAVAVLFLFMIMLIDIKNDKLLKKNFILTILAFICIGVSTTYQHSFFLKSETQYERLPVTLESASDLTIIGQILYNHMPIAVLILGLILLLALIGSVFLTYSFLDANRRTYKKLRRKQKNILNSFK